jgi:hypothetical protein
MASSHLQVIFMPPVHFSIVILQRGTIIHWGAAGIPPVAPIGPAVPVPIPGIPIPARSITIALVMVDHPPHLVAGHTFKNRHPCVCSVIEPHYANDGRDFNIKLKGYFELRFGCSRRFRPDRIEFGNEPQCGGYLPDLSRGMAAFPMAGLPLKNARLTQSA